ncbi:MAG: DUF5723 family protein [Bacteroidota bacterium]
MESKAKKMIFNKCLVAFLILSGCAQMSFSQMDNTIHLLPIIPQSSYTNPAFRPKAKFYIGFPALSSVYAGVAHNGFAYRDMIKINHANNDSLDITMDNVLNKLAKNNYLSFNVNEELLAFGFKAKKSYFSFSLTEKASFRFGYPRDLISLGCEGNGQFIGSTLDLSGTGINFSYYHEFALGYMHDVRIRTETFTIGGRLKYLQGLMNVWTQRNDLTVDIAEDDFAHTANTGFLVNMCGPDSLLMQIDSINGDSIKEEFEFDPQTFLLNSTNSGYGIDLGAFYKLNKDFSFGVSVLDLGYIKWKKGGGNDLRNYSSNVQDFMYDGLDVNQFFNQEDSVMSEKMDEIIDSLANIFKISSTKNSYSAPLTTKMYITAIYTITKHDKVGLLMRSEFFNNRMYSSFTLSYNKWFFNMLSAAVSYSVMNRSYLNLGFAMALNLGPWQTYVSTDNLYCLFDPEGTRTVNLHFGINFIFGYKEAKPNYSLFRDTPKESIK